MDGHQFDQLLRTLVTSRRSIAGLVLVAGSAISGRELAEARKKKPCPPCKKRKKGKCKAKLPNGTLCAGGTCQDGACSPPSCADGVKNGNETGVDCGGPDCPRCANGQTCESRDDCRSAMCDLQTFTCQGCVTSADCGSNDFGQCLCYTNVRGVRACHHSGMPPSITSCTQCPAPNSCVEVSPGQFECFALC
jgi:hypothetical protein